MKADNHRRKMVRIWLLEPIRGKYIFILAMGRVEKLLCRFAFGLVRETTISILRIPNYTGRQNLKGLSGNPTRRISQTVKSVRESEVVLRREKLRQRSNESVDSGTLRNVDSW